MNSFESASSEERDEEDVPMTEAEIADLNGRLASFESYVDSATGRLKEEFHRAYDEVAAQARAEEDAKKAFARVGKAERELREEEAAISARLKSFIEKLKE